MDLTAEQIAEFTRLNRNTINKILTLIRVRILEIYRSQSAPLVEQIEVDESYFGARRVKGRRGRGAKGKTIVFGLLKRGDKVYTEIVDDTLQLRCRVSSEEKPILRALFTPMVGVGIMV